MKNKSLKRTICILLTALFIISVLQMGMIEVFAEGSADTLTLSELQKVAEGLNLTESTSPYSLGEGHSIFNYDSEAFKSLIKVSSAPEKLNINTAQGDSFASLAEDYSKNQNIGVSAGATIPTQAIDLGLEANFSYEKKRSLSSGSIKEERYEIYEIVAKQKLVKINLKSKNIADGLDENFVSDLEGISDISSAKLFLNNYGTHIFENYYLGGSLGAYRYICSSTNYAQDYSSEGISFSIGADVAEIANAAANNTSFTAKSKDTSNRTSLMTTNVKIYGGDLPAGATYEHMFSYLPQVAGPKESGYGYDDWLKGVGENNNLSVVKVENPVALWDLLYEANICDYDTYGYLRNAYLEMYYENNGKICQELNISTGYISKIEYTYPGYDKKTEITPQTNTIYIPKNTSAEIFISDDLTLKYDLSTFSFELVGTGASCASITGNVLNTYSDTGNKSLGLVLKQDGKEFDRISIVIKKGDFDYGYGTKDQPYIINSMNDWEKFCKNQHKYNTQSFKLNVDIDLNGKIINPIGDSSTPFLGSFDGEYHTIKNATIIPSYYNQNIGLFSGSSGEISNLYLENIKVLNDGIYQTDNNYNVGVLVGSNYGEISNISIKNSSIRFVANMKNSTNELNIGVITGLNYGTIDQCSVNRSYLCGISYDGKGIVNAGGLVGSVALGTVTNCLLRNSEVKSVNFNSVRDNKEVVYYVNKNDGKIYKLNDKREWVFVINENDYKNGTGYNFEGTTYSNLSELLKKIEKLNKNINPKVEYLYTNSSTGMFGTLSQNTIFEMCVGYANNYYHDMVTFAASIKSWGFFGNIAGQAKGDVKLINCYYESTTRNDINNTKKEGCSQFADLKYSDIKGIDTSIWKRAGNTKPILRWEEDV